MSSFCSAKATHIFSAKNIRILYIESAKTVNEMTLNELVKLMTLWRTRPRYPKLSYNEPLYKEITVIKKLQGEGLGACIRFLHCPSVTSPIYIYQYVCLSVLVFPITYNLKQIWILKHCYSVPTRQSLHCREYLISPANWYFLFFMFSYAGLSTSFFFWYMNHSEKRLKVKKTPKKQQQKNTTKNMPPGEAIFI